MSLLTRNWLPSRRVSTRLTPLVGLWSALKDHFRYHGVLSPAVRLMRKLRFSYKILLVGSAFGVPALHVITLHMVQEWRVWQYAQVHTEYAVKLQAAHRLNASLAAWVSAVEPTNAHTAAVEQAFDGLTQHLDRTTSPDGWAKLNQAMARYYAAAAEDRASEAIEVQAAVHELDLQLAATGGLDHLANRSIHQLVEATTRSLPGSQRAMTRLIHALDTHSEHSHDLTLIDIVTAGTRLRDALMPLQAEQQHHAAQVSSCMKASSDLQNKLDTLATDITKRAGILATQPELAPALAQQARAMLGDIGQAQDHCSRSLSMALEQAQQDQRADFLQLCLIVVGGVGMALYMTLAFARVMKGGMDVVQSEVARMSRGDLSGKGLKNGLENLREPYRGVVTTYDKPFSNADHDAISANMLWLGTWRGGERTYAYKEDASRATVIRRKE